MPVPFSREDNRDRINFLNLFADVCDRYNWVCHSYCLMSNHYHLLIETPDGNLSKGRRQLNGVYSQLYNCRHKLVGHVFQGRYHAILVEKETHLKELARYVVLNPVRAGIVMNVEQWRWSSYRAMIAKTSKPTWLETDWLLSTFHSNRKQAIQAFTKFVAAGKGVRSPLDDRKNPLILGSDEFIETNLARLELPEDLTEFTKAQRTRPAKPVEWYRENASSRNDAIAIAYQSGRYSMKEIGDCFGLGYSMVSRIIKNSRFKT
ncbi:transposase [Arenicella xantha]|uniref:REP element-mobilizing transposase RayT n=1 Tax=Arenicella xantha TaxID=644221 RepID=A0A395JHP7_9GAMM|nr:transposase [Arenicella xantha]RBP48403.1 REP element-mobilizing transposase RayT [Arenicella xantha]